MSAMPKFGPLVTADGVPDPASRFQPNDVSGPSEVIDLKFDWRAADWKGRPWHECVFMEIQVGTFTPAGTFRGVIGELDHLADLGIAAFELMPLSDFSGGWNWGYDGVPRRLLIARKSHIIPLLPALEAGTSQAGLQDRMLSAHWFFQSGQSLEIFSNLSDRPIKSPLLAGSHEWFWGSAPDETLSPWSVHAAIGER